MDERGAATCAGGPGWRRTSWGFDLLDGRGFATPAQFSNELPPVAAGYEIWRRRSLSILSGKHFPLASELALITDLLPPHGVCVDLACSTALYGRHLAAQPAVDLVYAIDMAEPMLREARREIGREGLYDRVVLLRCRGQEMPFGDGSIDAVYCGGSLNEMGDPVEVLAETRRVLKTGGAALFMLVLEATTWRGRAAQALLGGGGIRFFDEERLSEVVQRAGLTTQAFERYGAVGFLVAGRA